MRARLTLAASAWKKGFGARGENPARCWPRALDSAQRPLTPKSYKIVARNSGACFNERRVRQTEEGQDRDRLPDEDDLERIMRLLTEGAAEATPGRRLHEQRAAGIF